MTLHKIFLLIFLLILGFLYNAKAQNRASKAQQSALETKSQWDLAEEARNKQDWATAAAAYRRVIELDPNNDEAHSQFISASKRSHKPNEAAAVREELFHLYQRWADKHPHNALFQLHLGELCGSEKSKAEPYYLKAIALNPKLAKAYMELSLIADMRGENEKRRAYLKKAAAVTPKEPTSLFYYSQAVKESNPTLYRKLVQMLLKQFPQHERSAQVLYGIAYETTNKQKKRSALEQLRRDFPLAKYLRSRIAMEELFNVCVQSEPAQALALAEEMTRLDPKNKNWANRLTMQQNCLQACTLIGERKFAEAAALLESTTPPRYTNTTALYLTKAEAYDLGGETTKAFDSLAKVIAVEPKDELLQVLHRYGAKLGKSVAEIDADLWRIRDEQAKPFKEFALAKYIGTGTATPNDYRGKVVLVTFWYPTCSSCRGEFPNLQKALDKYGSQGFMILAINVEPSEDNLVLPYLKSHRYGFIPLKSNWEWAEETYGVRATPTAYLLDRKGRIIFKPGGPWSAEEYQRLELQIETLLAQGTAAQ